MKSKSPTTPRDPDLLENLPSPPSGPAYVPPSTAASLPFGERLKDDQEMFLPVHGFVRFTEEELEIVDHPAFQRLGGVFQLGHAHLVYRGATHKRMEHVLGTAHVAQQIIDAVEENHARLSSENEEEGNCELCQPFSLAEQAFIRLSALLHDIGHFPCGHTLEDELGILEEHDKLKRLNMVMDFTEWRSGPSKKLREIVNDKYRRYLPEKAASPTEIVFAIVAKDGPEVADRCGDIRIQVCRDVIGNTICADLLDYLYRDWHHIGKPKYKDTRLFQYMQIRQIFPGKPKFVISLGPKDRPRTDAISSIIDLLESRYQLSEAVLFHRTKCSAAAMLERALHEISECAKVRGESTWGTKLEKDMMHCSDSSVIDYLLGEGERLGSDVGVAILQSLHGRKVYRQLFTFFYNDDPMTGDQVQSDYTKSPDAKEKRLLAARAIEQDFRLPPGSIAMYCPEARMNAKIARVQLHNGDRIATMTEWIKAYPTLGGDHLKGQVDRFHSLWRIHLCVAREVWDGMSETEQALLKRLIDEVLLGRGKPNRKAAAKNIAADIINLNLPRFKDVQLVEETLAANSRVEGNMHYSCGAPFVRAFLAARKSLGENG